MMDEAVKFLGSQYSQKMTLDALVLHMGYGRTQLFHLFKQHTGLTPNEYLVRFRIKQAKAMLVNTSKPLATTPQEAAPTALRPYRHANLPAP